MYTPGDVIDGRYTVEGICSDSGGMGVILFVTPVEKGVAPSKGVLKYCREIRDDYLQRFRREIRLLLEYAGNGKVVQVLDHNLSHDPPYYVMPYYSDGDLTTLHASIKDDFAAQEQLFLQMIDCLSELHSKNMFHRDIKPQNFLRDGGSVRVSDFGLSMECNSATAFTHTSQYGGTESYLPPEYRSGGFKYADAQGDIFMLGKTFYALLTQRDPLYVIGNEITESLFHLIQKCCEVDKARRYQTLAELKQAVVVVYDILLKRVDGLARSRHLQEAISSRLNQLQNYSTQEINDFLDSVSRLDGHEKNLLISEIPSFFFQFLTYPELEPRLAEFLVHYRQMVEAHDYSYEYAQTIASNMNVLFDSGNVKNKDKATALELAMDSAISMNRFAAMDTCQAMIVSVNSDALAFLVRDILLKYPDSFIRGIEPVNCSHNTIANTIRELSEN